jgi:hypothetical protein
MHAFVFNTHQCVMSILTCTPHVSNVHPPQIFFVQPQTFSAHTYAPLFLAHFLCQTLQYHIFRMHICAFFFNVHHDDAKIPISTTYQYDFFLSRNSTHVGLVLKLELCNFLWNSGPYKFSVEPMARIPICNVPNDLGWVPLLQLVLIYAMIL